MRGTQCSIGEITLRRRGENKSQQAVGGENRLNRASGAEARGSERNTQSTQTTNGCTLARTWGNKTTLRGGQMRV